jgi:glucokinase
MNPKCGYTIGIDIGGTKIAIGIVNEHAEVLVESKLPTQLKENPYEMINAIVSEIGQLLTTLGISNEQINGIGIGAPGPLDAKQGIISCPPNLLNWKDVQIIQAMKEHFPCKIILENDANAATLGEKWAGVAKNSNHFLYMTISTGIGAGLFLDGKLVTGAKGNAGEIGHIVIDPSKGTCICGQKGCLEWIASGTAIARRGSEIKGKPLTTKEVFQLYTRQDPEIVALIEDVFHSIGVGCVTLINLFDPELIVIGGGVSEVGAPLFESVQNYIQKYALNPAGRSTKVVPSRLRNSAGVIGAAALVTFSSACE